AHVLHFGGIDHSRPILSFSYFFGLPPEGGTPGVSRGSYYIGKRLPCQEGRRRLSFPGRKRTRLRKIEKGLDFGKSSGIITTVLHWLLKERRDHLGGTTGSDGEVA
ncbi:hypothetical protein, partial [uncultured Oscillibacter sp.]|uniref:hypothetical protein n=1 Tax=uncultured Oscillibacter sp. TaxID=876091 RepID=UPI002602CAD7